MFRPLPGAHGEDAGSQPPWQRQPDTSDAPGVVAAGEDQRSVLHAELEGDVEAGTQILLETGGPSESLHRLNDLWHAVTAIGARRRLLRGIELSCLAASGDALGDQPEAGFRDEVVAPIEPLGDVLRGKRLLSEVEERMNLGDGPVDARCSGVTYRIWIC